MQFVTREQWGASPTSPAADLPTARGVKVHWIGGPYRTPDHSGCAAEVRAILAEHLANKKEGWIDIAYNLIACQHAVVFEGRGASKMSGANGNRELNTNHYAVCAIQGTDEQASDLLKQGLRDAIEYLQERGAGPEILGHKDGYPTDCPGDELYAWVRAGAPRPGGTGAGQEHEPSTPQTSGLTAPPFPGRVMRLTSPTMQGPDVQAAQERLLDRTWSLGPDGADGWYGEHTEATVRAFQADSTRNGWPLAVDGELGPQTWRALWERPVSP
ncbi:N-acetylmuramoyl-L-alanine amidase [Kitasatospora sp. RB6PN24]|uniref:peptidoglycan recognition protein family protein n=1 Tax=Kitasatospora humi TaxID=2893891 RepID=UPI001E4FFA6B|nr:N-acetylmuramoyl-L-alanine amidase [Kitasatospora humi]MCC9309281.1 N-acetylmuramoyl-L-alanine amidase [Kitasatospora humi]